MVRRKFRRKLDSNGAIARLNEKQVVGFHFAPGIAWRTRGLHRRRRVIRESGAPRCHCDDKRG
jgi:hypothetical protein